VEGLHTYVAAGVDFIELNESCPNVPHDTSWRALEQRLQWIAEHFLARRERRVPVVVKVSLDISPEMLVSLLEVLTRLGYDGITLGNTSTAYESALASLAPAERAAFVRFWRSIGGGISGAPLAEQRRRLVRLAWHWLSQHPPQQEFHIIAVGGIMTPEELQTALAEGASLAQWYTGYIAAFAEHGDELYRWMYSTLTTDP
jgi:dihydroorotate dehydrogenase